MLIVELAILYLGSVNPLKDGCFYSICRTFPGGQFNPESPGQFPPESVVSFLRNQVVNITGISIVTDDLDLLMPAGNKMTVVKVWTDSTSTPITDIQNVVNAAQARGITFAKILISRVLWFKVAGNTEVTNFLKGYFNPGSNAKYAATLENVNQVLGANLLPTLELVDEVVGVEKDGIITAMKPFSQTAASFIPNGPLGIIHNAFAMEQMKPVEKVSYASFERTLISKWSENDPWAEYTAAELNAFPGIEAIDSIYILDTATATV